MGTDQWADIKSISDASQAAGYAVCREMNEYLSKEGSTITAGCDLVQYDCNTETIEKKLKEYN